MKSVIVKLSAVSDDIPGIYDRQHRHRKIDRMGHRKVIGGFSSSFREIIKMLKKKIKTVTEIKSVLILQLYN